MITAIRAAALRLMYGLGIVLGIPVAIYVYFKAKKLAARVFHASGTVCNGELIALDDVVGPRLAGAVRVRLSGSSEPEGSPKQTILGMALEIGGGEQDLLLATFESFLHAKAATANTNVADYLANQYASVTPWKVGSSIVWFRALPAAQPPGTGTRVERLDASIAAGRATFILEMRDGPGPDGALRAKIAELRITERLPTDDAAFKMSMLRTARGLVPTGLRNGIRRVAYPASQRGRRQRGG